MINNIIAFSIKNRLTVALLTIALVTAGIWSMTRIPIDAVPDITNNQVQVITQAPNLGTEDIEQFVTYPVELAMANLPGVTEIRSISRFGLSVVTIVFEDDDGTYLPRQLVAEKLNQIQDEIPQGFGKPMIGPISTGLGEIYQYTLEVDEAYRDKYSSADLRSIQDWIIRRQMAMVKGVIEVNAFGGDVKQYEVAVKPDVLRSMGITLSDVFSALEKNNQNTGGAYIEKDHQANFIRGKGLARSLDDLQEVLVKNVNGIPITISDIAEVQFGRAVKYGAFTKDGKGEAVGGMILMLKGANSRKVINSVKKRVTQIQKSLPEGVEIVPFLDRSTLIKKTTGTVSTNLLEGALIVIFILVFLLGNWRGGLIVASTIPLSLLFAFILMNAFGVWANLMSLGAIDFGIIIDGAVIIVESTVFMLYNRVLKGQKVDGSVRDEIAKKSSSKMMNSAFFGQLIILIVFIPILALQGVEGKMFKPMALTFMFAMLGVMILCLTYVPMMSSWFLRVNKTAKLSWGDKLVKSIENGYSRLLNSVMKKAWLVILVAVALLATSTFLFSKMGGEFIPQLDEGDIAFHSILKPGSSLTETIEVTTQVENILMDNFPDEIKRVLCRIGVADVPTDPMPMDIADCFIILNPEQNWKWTKGKAELVESMKKKVLQVPGINFEFTQPIEMRFNELITGVREDVAVKLFGEDLSVLASKAEEIGKVVATVDGVADMKVESTKGLPQMTVDYNRSKLAQYGLHIDDINKSLQTAFAGAKAGVIFEGEKRFDLVVRYAEKSRQSIEDIRNLYINLPNGSQIPMKEVAEINYEPGPMQISRDNTNRRVYVGVNVRGRDVKSVVEEIRGKVESTINLPTGYYIRYGGAFENLERAEKRLKVVVPISLGLIFILIFFALKSLKQSTMIYIAIPLAAIGGVFSLWLRDMPFSISAGVGFIVLFGVAVLNGLVLISSWNELKDEGVTNLNERIALGARSRIRPILLTALTDVLGFLPMAISNSAGAEVQRPLATVVIGGMISATLLTLFILPILYRWLENREMKRIKLNSPVLMSFLLLFGLLSSYNAQAQNAILEINSLEEALEMAKSQNQGLQAQKAFVDVSLQNERTALNFPKTEVNIQYGQYNSFYTDFGFNIKQNLQFPSVYIKQGELAKTKTELSESALAIQANNLKHKVSKQWYQLAHLHDKKDLLMYQDSLYAEFLRVATIRYQLEASTLLEKMTAETQRMQVQNELQLLDKDIEAVEIQLKMLLNIPSEVLFQPEKQLTFGSTYPADSSQVQGNPLLVYAHRQIDLANAQVSVQSAKALPELSLGYFNQSFIGAPTSDGTVAVASDRFTGIQAGISVPLFFGSYKAQVSSAKLKAEAVKTQSNYMKSQLAAQFQEAMLTAQKQQVNLNYYQSTALPQAEQIIANAEKSFKNEAIGYIEYFQNINLALSLKRGNLEAINEYNQAVLELEYLVGE